MLRGTLFAFDRDHADTPTGPDMTTWDVLTGSAIVPSGLLTELAALRAALPGYEVTITSHSRARPSAPLPSRPSASFLVTETPVPSMTA